MSLLAILFALLLSAVEDTVGEMACRASETARALDFWIGEWTVVSAADEKLGDNVIERKLDGCAVLEHWTGAGGSKGKSLFYFDAKAERWEQIWVTEDTSRPFGLKHKILIADYSGPGVRFQGVIDADGSVLLDRTTLVPLDDGRVRQLIEYSKDDGANWQTSFDAIYVPAK